MTASIIQQKSRVTEKDQCAGEKVWKLKTMFDRQTTDPGRRVREKCSACKRGRG